MTAVLDTRSIVSTKELEFQVVNKIGKNSSVKASFLGRGVPLLEAIAREPGLGFAGMVKRAGIANESNDLPRDAMALGRECAQRVQLTCHPGVFEQGEAVYVSRLENARDIVVKSHVGQGSPVNDSALGKSLVAWLAPVFRSPMFGVEAGRSMTRNRRRTVAALNTDPRSRRPRGRRYRRGRNVGTR